jgi:hypothetical protein
MVTIVLPTVSRPAMLRTALESVADQSASDAISRIFVSENGASRESEAVCREFPSLPITYVFRNSMSPMDHARTLMRECLHGELTAILHDDDWWAPSHLANAMWNLKSNTDAVAYCANHLLVAAESSLPKCCDTQLFAWFGANYAPLNSVWELSRTNVLMGGLLGTMAHYSSLVVRTAAMKSAAYVYDLENPFDNDRMLLFALSKSGSLMFNPLPEVFVRYHGAQECASFDSYTKIKHMCDTTRWMVQTNGKPLEIVAKTFMKRVAMCPPEAVELLKARSEKEWCLPELNRQLLSKALMAA